MVLLAGVIGAGIGGIFSVIRMFTNITNEYAIFGIGTGVGAVFGIILGIFLLIALRTNIVEDYGTGYGIGIGANIFIGAIIGISIGAPVGALVGFFLDLGGYIFEGSNFSLIVFGVLAWMVLGLNIGVLVGIITSFGFTGIVFGGIISGLIVGTIGSLAIFGPSIAILVGAFAGSIVGLIIGLLIKFSIRASMGIEEDFAIRNICDCDKDDDGVTESRYRRHGSGGLWYFFCCYDDDDDCDCDGGGGGSDCGAAILYILVPIIAAVVAVALLIIVVNLSLKASKGLGKAVRRGGATAFGASLSIMMIIGANTGLTATFHQTFEIYYIIAIGAGLGIIFGIILTVAQSLSVKQSYLKIAPHTIEWKDRHTRGLLLLQNVEDYEFCIDETEKKFTGDILEYAKFYLRDGTDRQIIINCWNIDEETPIYSNEIKAVIAHYLQPIIEERRQQVVARTTAEKPREPTQTITLGTQEIGLYTVEEVEILRNLIGDRKKMSVQWLSTVTQLSPLRIEEIAEQELGRKVKDGFVVPQEVKETYTHSISEQDIEKVRNILGDRKKMSVKWISTVTKIPTSVIEEIAVKHLERKIHGGFIIS